MEPLTPTHNSLSTKTIPLLIWTTPSPNILLRLKVCIPSVVPKTSNLSTGVKILSVFKKADRWIAKIFVAKLLPYVQHSHVTQPQNNKTNSDSVKNLCSAQLLFLLNFISVKGYFLKCCEVWPELSMKDLFFVSVFCFQVWNIKQREAFWEHWSQASLTLSRRNQIKRKGFMRHWSLAGCMRDNSELLGFKAVKKSTVSALELHQAFKIFRLMNIVPPS